MPFSGIANPQELNLLHKVLDDYCVENEIVAEQDRAAVGQEIFSLYARGLSSAEALKRALGRVQAD